MGYYYFVNEDNPPARYVYLNGHPYILASHAGEQMELAISEALRDDRVERERWKARKSQTIVIAGFDP